MLNYNKVKVAVLHTTKHSHMNTTAASASFVARVHAPFSRDLCLGTGHSLKYLHNTSVV